MRTVDTVLMDKTGTLTTGRPTVERSSSTAATGLGAFARLRGGSRQRASAGPSDRRGGASARARHPRRIRVPVDGRSRCPRGRRRHRGRRGWPGAPPGARAGCASVAHGAHVDVARARCHRPHRRQGRETDRFDRPRGCGSSGVPPSGTGPASGRAPRHDDHRRRARGRRGHRPGPGDRRGPSRGPAGGQGIGRRRAPGGRAAGGDGRRRRERRAGARSCRRRHRDRRGHRRRDRIRRRGARERRPARRPERVASLARQLREDDPEPRVGHGIQRARHPSRGRSARPLGIRASSCRRRGRDEPVHDRRRVQRLAPQAAGSSSER